MKNIKNLIFGLGLLSGTTLLGQTTVRGWGTYIPSRGITAISSVKAQVAAIAGGNKRVTITGILGKAPGNTNPVNPQNQIISGGPLFYTQGPGGATLTCGSSGVCAELSNTTYIQYVSPW
jgi:hypothetical protein